MDTYKYPPEVAWQINQDSKKEHVDFAEVVNKDPNISGVILQHEYGIFGGNKGENILSFINNCTKPILVTLHTVLPEPSVKMKEVTTKIIKRANTIVVLTENSKQIIEKVYPESVSKVFVVSHGIHSTPFSTPASFKKKLMLENNTVLTTFGLLSRGKGLEYVIQALPDIVQKYPSVIYLILGETHPVIRRNEGERYRNKLIRLVKNLKLEKYVKFYDQYMNLLDLFQFLKATDIYIATSTNPNQAVSGTLSYALGTGRAVVSTEFAQAKEIITPETGRLVPLKDSEALTTALLDLLSNEKRLKQMHKNAYKKTRPMLWSNVAEKYIELLTRTIIPPIKLDHLHKLTDSFGLFQFASLSYPNKDFGYTLDDNARALILCSWLIKRDHTKELENFIHIYLSFIQKCQRIDGSFINYIEYNEKSPTRQNSEENLEDVQGRALWALAEIMSNKKLSTKLRDQAHVMFNKALKNGSKLTYIRSQAFAIKAFSVAINGVPEYKKKLTAIIQRYADSLVKALKDNSLKSWQWFESYLSYNNALLPESLIIAGSITKNSEYMNKGMLSLQFLIDKTFSSHMYRPIGQSYWYTNNQKRSHFDQQPEDPASMILALETAYRNTNLEKYKKLATLCFSWFLGNNNLHTPLYNEKTGGCYDGLQPDQVNFNQGAESLISYLMASYTIQELH